MAGHGAVAQLPRQRRLGEVSRALLQVGRLHTGHDDVVGPDAGDLQAEQRIAVLHEWDQLLIRRDDLGPSGSIDVIARIIGRIVGAVPRTGAVAGRVIVRRRCVRVLIGGFEGCAVARRRVVPVCGGDHTVG
jgi:hypothetical protein